MICPVCGVGTTGDVAVCAHHLAAEYGWAEGNRILCNLLHRGLEPSRLPVLERGDEPIVSMDVE